jgi:biopolymer transport protein ExbD
MKKLLYIFIVSILISCEGKKEIQLPKANTTIVADVLDHSPVYVFFKVNGKDTIADVNRKNTIGTTNWIFNIDKRLPLSKVIPEVIWLQNKKKKGMHVNEEAQNYYSYANDSLKTMAFLPFTNTEYKLEKPKSGVIVYFRKDDKILVDDKVIQKDSLENYLNKLSDNIYHNINFCFDKNCSYDNYIKKAILIRNLEIELVKPEEFIY